MAKYLKNFPPGPLDCYRKIASFDWKQLRVFLDTEDIVKFEHELFEEFKKHQILQKPLRNPTHDELRHLSVKRAFAFKTMDIISLNSYLEDLNRPAAALLRLIQLDPSSYIKFSLSSLMFTSVIQSTGTSRHMDFVEKALTGEIVGCFCLTEIGHGSNVKSMRTMATYDKTTKEFIMHSPDFEAAKCWAGCLGQMATHAIVFAQLVSEGVNYGLHSFVVPVRDTKTLVPLPGVTVGDMGEKVGLNGIDNGFLMFDNFRIPRQNLLNKTGDITDDGKYVSPYKDPNKRHGASLGALSVGRVNITNIATAYCCKAISIAVRYAAVRKQFGPNDVEEVPILEFQTHQHRLLPHLAVAYALKIFSAFLVRTQYQFSIDQLFEPDKKTLPDLGLEMHAISSASKPISSWMSRDAIQECREACAGHGYLKAAGLGDIRDDNDANCTYEGENHVLIQQTSNWLLKLWPLILKQQKLSSPLKSIDFLSDALEILRSGKFSARDVTDVCSPEHIISTYQWLVCFLLKSSFEKMENNLKAGADPFWAKIENQVFYAKSLSAAYIHHFILQQMLDVINNAPDPSIKNVLLKLFSLYGLFNLEKQVNVLYQGGFAVGPAAVTLIQDAILKLCKDLKDDAVALVDVIAPPDFILNSVLGASDGLVYKHLQTSMMSMPGAMSRPDWWRDIVDWKSYTKSKL